MHWLYPAGIHVRDRFPHPLVQHQDLLVLGPAHMCLVRLWSRAGDVTQLAVGHHRIDSGSCYSGRTGRFGHLLFPLMHLPFQVVPVCCFPDAADFTDITVNGLLRSGYFVVAVIVAVVVVFVVVVRFPLRFPAGINCL